MTKRETRRLHIILARLEALEGVVKDRRERELLREGKNRLLELLRMVEP